jgi:purine-nucleoside phosphorylase
MPARLQPTASLAAEAILVGDPGRALLLAQELLEQPKMSNHARGLWGYTGQTEAGQALTIQSTGMGGPSAALVLGDLSELGVRRAVRVGTCSALGEEIGLGELLLAVGAVAVGASATALGTEVGETVLPNKSLTERIAKRLEDAGCEGTVASVDAHPAPVAAGPESGALATDMQTAALLARARALGIEAAALLIVSEAGGGGELLEKDALELAEKRAGHLALAGLSS